MNRYDKENAAERIDGYYFPAPHERTLGKTADAFDREKAETLKNMRAAIEHIEALSVDDFLVITRRKRV